MYSVTGLIWAFVFVGLFWSGVDVICETDISVNPVLAVIFVEGA